VRKQHATKQLPTVARAKPQVVRRRTRAFPKSCSIVQKRQQLVESQLLSVLQLVLLQQKQTVTHRLVLAPGVTRSAY
jgi:hypothetical protein